MKKERTEFSSKEKANIIIGILSFLGATIPPTLILIRRGNESKQKEKQREEDRKMKEEDRKKDMDDYRAKLIMKRDIQLETKRAEMEMEKEYSTQEVDDLLKTRKREANEVKAKVYDLLGLGRYRRPEARPMLEPDEKSDVQVTPTPLVGDLIKRGDRVLVAGIPGAGKTAFVTQLACDISSGNPSKLLPGAANSGDGQAVFLFDAELDSDDRTERYGRAQFDSKLKRVSDPKFPTPYFLLDDAYSRMKDVNGDVTFIYDNLYALCPTLTTDETKDLFDGFKIIQEKAIEAGNRVTIIVVTHTVKDSSLIPTLEDIAGSAHCSRFAKSVYLIADANQHGTALLLNLKRRHRQKSDIAVLHMSNEPMLHFEHVKYVSEVEAQKYRKGKTSKTNESMAGVEEKGYSHDVITEVCKLGSEGVSYRGIAKIMAEKGINISHTQVGNILRAQA